MARLDEVFRIKRFGNAMSRRQAENYRKYVKVAYCLLTGLFTARELAKVYDVSESLIHYWCDSALKHDTPESEALRRLAYERRREVTRSSGYFDLDT